MRFFDVIFFIDIVRNFLTEYTKDGETVPCRDLKKIAVRYIKNGFKMDLICWIPFWELGVDDKVYEFSRILFFLKCMRVLECVVGA